MLQPKPRPLPIEEILEAAELFKQDLMREAKRAIRQKNLENATTAIAGEEVIDRFVYDLKMRAGSRLQEYLSRPPRARDISLKLIKR